MHRVQFNCETGENEQIEQLAYKNAQNQLVVLDVGEPSVGLTLITVEEAATLAPPPFAISKIPEIASYIETREKMCARVAGIGQRLARSGDTAGALSCDAVVEALLDLLNHASVQGATDIVSFKAALKARYNAAVALATASARNEFKRYDK